VLVMPANPLDLRRIPVQIAQHRGSVVDPNPSPNPKESVSLAESENKVLIRIRIRIQIQTLLLNNFFCEQS
jgi:hypothetical protein